MTEKNIQHIMKFDEEDQGKQGITGIAKVDGLPYVYKISQFMNYLTEHEFTIMKGLNELLPYCPHFPKISEMVNVDIPPNFTEQENPFSKATKNIELPVLFMEYINKSIPLYELIQDRRVSFNSILVIIKQVLMATIIAQRKKHFVHYDLHSLNVLMKKCDKHDVFLYILDEENAIFVPTYGYIPIIIDFGFGYSDDLQKLPMYCPLAYTDAGYMSPGYDCFADPKIFLVSVAEDFKECGREGEDVEKFHTTVENIFAELDIDWRSGWDRVHDETPLPFIDQIFYYVENDFEQSPLFKNYAPLCNDMLHSLITLPLKPTIESDLRQMRRAYKSFVKEFCKVEEEISNTFFSLYIFRCMVNIVRSLRDTYANTETQAQAVCTFKQCMIDSIRKIANYCKLDTVNFEMLLCSLFVFQEHLESKLYYMLEKKMIQKYTEYNAMDVNSLEDIFVLIDTTLTTEYKFSKKTKVHIYDIQQEKSSTLDVSAHIRIINKMNQISIGPYLHDLYNVTQKETELP
jgi:hypothetical protein